MSKHSGKKAALILSLLALLCVIALAAAETDLSSLWNMGCRLAFDTNNVTLNASASFALDGTGFKSAEGTYLQDSTNSLMEVSVHTPLHSGDTRDTGFTVLGKEGMAWSWDQGDGYYTEWGVDPSSSVIRRPYLKDALQAAGQVYMNVLSLTGSRFVTGEEQADGSRVYRVRIGHDDLPEEAQAALMPLLSSLTQEYGYSTPGMYLSGLDELSPSVIYDDYEQLFAHVYEQTYGGPQPKDFWDRVMAADDALLPRYYEVFSLIADLEYEAATRENTYCSVLHADGTVSVYPDMASYILSTGDKRVCFDNADAAFAVYYEKMTGRELDMNVLTAANSYVNAALSDAWLSMFERMQEEYLSVAAADPEALGIHVYSDGSWQLLYTPDAVRAAEDRLTVFQQLLWLMEDLRLEEADLTVTADRDGNLTSVSGTLDLTVVCEGDVPHLLQVSLDCTASGYGTTSLEHTGTEIFPVPDWETYYTAAVSDSAEPAETDAEAPRGTVLFDGREYTLEPFLE